MHIDLKGIHVEISEKTKEHLDHKIQKLDFASDMIMHLLFTITKEKSEHKIDVTINFRWGASAHISVESYDLLQGIDNLIDKVETKVIKEKEKIQEH